MSLLSSLAESGMVKAMVLGAARTALAGAVPALIQAHVLQANQTNDFIGAGCFFAALALSAFDKVVVGQKLNAVAGLPTQLPVSIPPTLAPAVTGAGQGAGTGPVTMAPIPNP